MIGGSSLIEREASEPSAALERINFFQDGHLLTVEADLVPSSHESSNWLRSKLLRGPPRTLPELVWKRICKFTEEERDLAALGSVCKVSWRPAIEGLWRHGQWRIDDTPKGRKRLQAFYDMDPTTKKLLRPPWVFVGRLPEPMTSILVELLSHFVAHVECWDIETAPNEVLVSLAAIMLPPENVTQLWISENDGRSSRWVNIVLRKCPKLRELQVYNATRALDLPPLEFLEDLALTVGTAWLRREIYTRIRGFQRLERLMIQGDVYEPADGKIEALHSLTRLKTLILGPNPSLSMAPDRIWPLLECVGPNLTTLGLSCISLGGFHGTFDDCARLRALCPQVRVLTLDSANIKWLSVSVEILLRFEHLRALSVLGSVMPYNAAERRVFEEVVKGKPLREFYFRWNSSEQVGGFVSGRTWYWLNWALKAK
ncbi:hypothetical protein M427DRAFT_167039 [Gonapodya prolifera JEL478]|uniref:F-box domain-containing protein n=1 Tax=Gonapodya prolifera (strain JEL478) TaxID=1344416 RepID=A0A139B0I5_GONPJ|nr:hypothetical protein M427DRAFT_167039 [Gonapodya prolifera JEL478]|eukprot:KXS22205.1 hypothetical protein M427DRAFT_167039 [Gonapodya prolifera JEL478]